MTRHVDPKRAAFVSALAACGLVLASCASVVDLESVAYGEIDAEVSKAPRDAGVEATSPADAEAPSTPGASKPTSGTGSCSVGDDGKLHCTNRANAPLRALPKASSAVVNTLRTTESYFLCWGTGEPHAGGNSTWYYTIGDDNPNLGWLPGVMLETPDAFDADPKAYGLRNCSE